MVTIPNSSIDEHENNQNFSAPELSVVMLVYNSEKYLEEAVTSVLEQTFTNFEFIIINDGSTDQSLRIIKSFSDQRIKVINNPENIGIPRSRNIGLKSASGKFLAWVDSDDIVIRQRFEKQISFLKEHPGYGVCGTWQKRFGGTKEFVARVSCDPESIKAKLLFKTSILNPTSMWNIHVIRKFHLTFNEELPISEDFDFYQRAAYLFPMANLPEVLHLYRASETSIMKKFDFRQDAYKKIHNHIYRRAIGKLGLTTGEEELRIHGLIASEELCDNFGDYRKSFEWLKTLKKQNNRKQIYNNRAFRKILGEEFFFISKKSSQSGIGVFFFYLWNCRGNFSYANIYKIFKLAVRCVIRYNKF